MALAQSLPYPRKCDQIARRSHHVFVLTLALMIAAFIGWANVTVIDKVKRGAGRVVPQIQNQIVQHFEGGILTEILVKEGDHVEKGSPMFRVENSFSQAELLQARLDIKAKRLRVARLDAEARNADSFTADPSLRDSVADIDRSEQEQFDTRRKILAEQLAILDEQLKQKKLELSELNSRWVNTQTERDLILQQVTSLRKLAAIGAVSNNELLEHERELQQVEGKISDLSSNIPQTESSIVEMGRRQTEVRLQFRTNAEKERADTELQLAKLEESVSAMADRATRSEVSAPIAGTVNKLFANTIGGTVKSGEPLAQIVPADTSIEVEARLSPADRAEVWPGLPAVVKVSAYDSSVYGGLQGKVMEISSDALQDERGQPYFRVKIEAQASSFGKDHPVVPGMVADVDILSGRQSIMEALLRPARILRDSALRLRGRNANSCEIRPSSTGPTAPHRRRGRKIGTILRFAEGFEAVPTSVPKADPTAFSTTLHSPGAMPDFLHDLANLLTAISGSLELILSRPDDAKRERWVRNALEAAELAAQLAAKHHLAVLQAPGMEDAGSHTIELPAREEGAAPRSRILVVDDEDSVRSYVAELLSALGYEVIEAAGGAAALGAIKGVLPDLFIVDFAMPSMTGAEFALRLLGRIPNARILFMSGAEDTAAMGAVDPDIPILRKPFRSADLAAAICEALKA